MLIEIWKEEDGRWIRYDSLYETTQLLQRYAALLTQSEEAAGALVVRFTAGVVVEFSRRVDDGSFLQASHAPAPPTRVRGSDVSYHRVFARQPPLCGTIAKEPEAPSSGSGCCHRGPGSRRYERGRAIEEATARQQWPFSQESSC